MTKHDEISQNDYISPLESSILQQLYTHDRENYTDFEGMFSPTENDFYSSLSNMISTDPGKKNLYPIYLLKLSDADIELFKDSTQNTSDYSVEQLEGIVAEARNVGKTQFKNELNTFVITAADDGILYPLERKILANFLEYFYSVVAPNFSKVTQDLTGSDDNISRSLTALALEQKHLDYFATLYDLDDDQKAKVKAVVNAYIKYGEQKESINVTNEEGTTFKRDKDLNFDLDIMDAFA